MKSLPFFSKSTTCQSPFIKKSWTTFCSTLSLCSPLGVPSVFCAVDTRSSWFIKFFVGRVGGYDLQDIRLGLWILKMFLNNQPPPQKKTWYCLAILSSQTKSDSNRNLLSSSRKALPAKGAVHPWRGLGQHSVQPSPCVHLLVCHLSSVLWTWGHAGLWLFFWESWGL